MSARLLSEAQISAAVEHEFDTATDGTHGEIQPERCPAGHPPLPHGTLVGWSPWLHGMAEAAIGRTLPLFRQSRECATVAQLPAPAETVRWPVVVGVIPDNCAYPAGGCSSDHRCRRQIRIRPQPSGPQHQDRPVPEAEQR